MPPTLGKPAIPSTPDLQIFVVVRFNGVLLAGLSWLFDRLRRLVALAAWMSWLDELAGCLGWLAGLPGLPG
jgi:hypothetical protein